MRSEFLVCALLAVIFVFGCIQVKKAGSDEKAEEVIKLPEPDYRGISVEEAIKNRRSVRDYSPEPLTLKELSQILWAAQGITSGDKRSAPSAGMTYPLEIYVVVGNVEGLEPGIYHYNPSEHEIEMVMKGDKRSELSKAALGQVWVQNAPVDLVFTAVYERTMSRYGERGKMYVHMEAGHAAQNVYLQSESLGLGTVVVGAFSDSQVKQTLGLKKGSPLYIMPLGRKKQLINTQPNN